MQKQLKKSNRLISRVRLVLWRRIAIAAVAVAAFLAIPAPGQASGREGLQTIRLRTGDKLLVYTQGGKTYAELSSKPGAQIVLTRGQYAGKASFEDFKVIGQTAGGVTILKEVYHTDANPNGFCGAGEEEILQVVATKPTCKQTFSIETGSCVTSRESGDGSIHWQPKSSILSLSWSQPQGEDTFEEKSEYQINVDGSVKQVSSKRTKL